jgi:hypothetical protein
VSILVEIAERADVSVEGVVRVLTREPVSEAVKERVLVVLDDLTPEQTRAVQRFALAALHDVLLRPDDVGDAGEPDPEQAALPAAAESLPASGSETALVKLGSVLGELAEAVRDLRRETDEERRERVDDLAVLIDLITTGWQGLDARLGRIEKQVARLEAGRREPVVIAPARAAPPADERAPGTPVVAESGKRGKLPIVATLSLVGAATVTLAVLQIASGGPDVSRLVASREPADTATVEASSTTSTPTSTRAETRPAATTARPPAQSPTTPPTTSGVLPSTSGATTRPKPPAAPTPPRTSSAPPAVTTRPATTAASPQGFEPTRNWAWAPVKDADYYDVVFTRSGKLLYRASPTAPRLTLPATIVFRRGAYRWVVRPGFGERGARNLGAPVVDSPFTVS